LPLSHISISKPSAVLFANGRVTCFGKNSNGQLGTGSTGDVAGSTTNPLSSRGNIDFADNSLEIISLSAGQSHNCLVRCDRTIVCFGSNASGELGQGSTSAQGDADGETAALNPIPFSPAKIVLMPVSITSVTLSTGETIALGPCRFVYTTWALDMDSVSVTSVAATPGATVTVNGGPMTATSVPLYRHLTNLLTVKATVGSASVEHLINVRMMASSSVTAGNTHTCVILGFRVTCFGVRSDPLIQFLTNLS
jgi:hypothetical protein